MARAAVTAAGLAVVAGCAASPQVGPAVAGDAPREVRGLGRGGGKEAPASELAIEEGVSRPDEEPHELPPLTADAPFAELAVEGFEAAVVSLPIGARAPRPLLVATHGAGGRAMAHCRLWRRIVENRGFVLCPRGRSMYPALSRRRHSGYYYPGHPQLALEMERAIAALGKRFGDHLDVEAPLFAGYSQGASMGALVLPDHSAGFGAAALVEGGVGQHQEWNLATAQRFRRGGGRRVLLVCGRAVCHDHAERSARLFERAEVGARVVFVAGAGHTYGGGVARQVAESFAWLVAEDPRWLGGSGALSPSRSPSSSPSASGSARRSRTTTR